MTRLFVSNLAFDTVGETELRDLFENYGRVLDVRVIRRDDRSRGFGFVAFANEDDATRARIELNDKDFYGRRLHVEEARNGGKR